MNLTAHPYAVLAELTWKQDHLAGAGRTARNAGRPTGQQAAPEALTRTWRHRIGHLPHVVRHLRTAAWNH